MPAGEAAKYSVDELADIAARSTMAAMMVLTTRDFVLGSAAIVTADSLLRDLSDHFQRDLILWPVDANGWLVIPEMKGLGTEQLVFAFWQLSVERGDNTLSDHLYRYSFAEKRISAF